MLELMHLPCYAQMPAAAPLHRLYILPSPHSPIRVLSTEPRMSALRAPPLCQRQVALAEHGPAPLLQSAPSPPAVLCAAFQPAQPPYLMPSAIPAARYMQLLLLQSSLFLQPVASAELQPFVELLRVPFLTQLVAAHGAVQTLLRPQ